ATGRELRRFAGFGEAIAAVAFTPDGRTLVAADKEGGGGADGGAGRAWAVADGRELGRWPSNGRTTALVIAPDGRAVATAGAAPAEVQVRELPAGRLVWAAAVPQAKAIRLRFTADGRGLTAVTDD